MNYIWRVWIQEDEWAGSSVAQPNKMTQHQNVQQDLDFIDVQIRGDKTTERRQFASSDNDQGKLNNYSTQILKPRLLKWKSRRNVSQSTLQKPDMNSSVKYNVTICRSLLLSVSECYRTNTNHLHNCRLNPHQIILPPGYLPPEYTWFLQEDQCVIVCICVISICFILKFSSSRVVLSSTSSLVCELTFSSPARLFSFPFCSVPFPRFPYLCFFLFPDSSTLFLFRTSACFKLLCLVLAFRISRILIFLIKSSLFVQFLVRLCAVRLSPSFFIISLRN